MPRQRPWTWWLPCGSIQQLEVHLGAVPYCLLLWMSVLPSPSQRYCLQQGEQYLPLRRYGED